MVCGWNVAVHIVFGVLVPAWLMLDGWVSEVFVVVAAGGGWGSKALSVVTPVVCQRIVESRKFQETYPSCASYYACYVWHVAFDSSKAFCLTCVFFPYGVAAVTLRAPMMMML